MSVQGGINIEILLYILADAMISGAILWLASKVVAEDLRFKEAVIVAGSAAALGLIPHAGYILSIIAFFYLLKKFTEADIWPNLILMTMISKLISLFVVLGLFK